MQTRSIKAHMIFEKYSALVFLSG